MTPERLRAYVLILTADVMPILIATFIVVYGLLTHQLTLWMGSLAATFAGVPFVRPRNGEDDGMQPPDTEVEVG